MIRTRIIHLPILFILAIAIAGTSFAQSVSEPVDDEANAIIREQGLENSKVMNYLSWITDVFGGRLTGSPQIDRATEWALGAMEEMGLTDVHKEAWGPFGRGWTVDSFSLVANSEHGSFPVMAYPKAWSPGTNGHVTGEVVFVQAETLEDLEKYRGKLEGKIVLTQSIREVEEPFEPIAERRDDSNLLEMANASPQAAGQRRGGRRFNPAMMERFRLQRQISSFVFTQNPAAVLDRGSKGDYGTIFVSGASVPAPPPDPNADFMAAFFRGPRAYDVSGPETVPQFTLAVEHYNRVMRMLDLGIAVTMDVMLSVEWNSDDPMEYNIFGEIPGTDPEIGDEVVMLGAHFDSWHAGTGAVDNAAGSAVMMEAMRILKVVYAAGGEGPRRTIRIGLWTGEEQGLLGSSAYVSDHFAESEGRFQPPTALKPEHDKLSAYYNYDNGTGRIRGVYMQGNAAVAPIFRAWLRPFEDLGAATLTINNTGGTDHLSFDGVGLPGFQFIQDEIAYSPKNHHSNMDVYDHAIAEDLMQSATIVASFVYHTAQRDEMIPRKPLPRPTTVAPSTGSR